MMPATLAGSSPMSKTAAPPPAPASEAPAPPQGMTVTVPMADLGVSGCKPGDVYDLHASGTVVAVEGDQVTLDVAGLKAEPKSEPSEGEMFDEAAGGPAYT